ncbi:OsmC family peroxiredoxin [Actinobacteria bacterium YIM 96077]|uniref:OsmC family peroxiredoxin n=1 Tax=Phytoactinopolyspora halophila TaxID=1981511 RepID=A0A329QPA4_9ACTN|nr:OsmC family protein [Phytoactinopolyspora halophila]AYY15040.1 OsmC family peroxiredoxin [Actinobacteria bacterium YIM 96077]RAW14194.1 OsmC family peroxiredoxin [Phytoactinopolyspora halophila]
MPATHQYEIAVEWTGNEGTGTSHYRAFSRAHEIRAEGKSTSIAASADPAFRGDAERWNPEELLVAALSECHMLWYLHLAANAGVVVTAYTDSPLGTMVMDGAGSGQFTEVTLRPVVTITDTAMADKAQELHHDAASKCFIARSVNFPVHHAPETQVA